MYMMKEFLKEVGRRDFDLIYSKNPFYLCDPKDVNNFIAYGNERCKLLGINVGFRVVEIHTQSLKEKKKLKSTQHRK